VFYFSRLSDVANYAMWTAGERIFTGKMSPGGLFRGGGDTVIGHLSPLTQGCATARLW